MYKLLRWQTTRLHFYIYLNAKKLHFLKDYQRYMKYCFSAIVATKLLVATQFKTS